MSDDNSKPKHRPNSKIKMITVRLSTKEHDLLKAKSKKKYGKENISRLIADMASEDTSKEALRPVNFHFSK